MGEGWPWGRVGLLVGVGCVGSLPAGHRVREKREVWLRLGERRRRGGSGSSGRVVQEPRPE